MSPEQLRRATHLKFNPWQSSRTALMKVGNPLKSVQLVKRADVKRGDDKDILRGRKRRFVRQMWTPAAIKSPTRQAAFGKAIIKKSRRQKVKKTKRTKKANVDTCRHQITDIRKAAFGKEIINSNGKFVI